MIEKGTYVKKDWAFGKVIATTPKFGGRVKVATGYSESDWFDAAAVTPVADLDSRDFDCECGGSGKFYSGGMVLNGVYTGKIGDCFRCGGHGMQSGNDRLRNRVYDAKYRRISA